METTKTYDGNNKATVLNVGLLAGVMAGHDVSVTAMANYNDDAVGTGKAITIAYTLSGKHASLYAAPKNQVLNNGEIKLAPSKFNFAQSGLVDKKVIDGNFTNPVTNGAGTGVITYSSDNKHVATVDSATGEVTIVGVGTAEITAKKAATATHDAVTKQYTVNVSLAPSDFTFASAGPINKTITEGKFTNPVTNGAGTGVITYTSSNPSAVTVNSATGEVTIIGVGTAEITAKKAATAMHDAVTKKYGVNVSLNPSDFSFAEPDLIQKKATDGKFTNPVTNGLGTGAITYTSNNQNVATVNPTTGEVTIVWTGLAYITATKAATATHAAISKNYTVSVTASQSLTNLVATLQEANSLYNSAVEGVEVGHYYVGSKAKLKPVIDATQAIRNQAANRSDSELATANDNLQQAVNEFKNSTVTKLYFNDLEVFVDYIIYQKAYIKQDESLAAISSNPAIAEVNGSNFHNGMVAVVGNKPGIVRITVQALKNNVVVQTGSYQVIVK